MSDQDAMKYLQEIKAKYNIDSDKMFDLAAIIKISGFGRNSQTANTLRAIADFIEHMNDHVDPDDVNFRPEGLVQ